MRWLVAFALAIVVLACSTRRDPDAAFWQWFVANKERVATIKTAREPVAMELAAQLKKIDSDLTFEVSLTPGIRELVVSADGLKRAFPIVKRLVAASPQIEGWKVIAFRPRHGADTTVRLDGQSLGPEALTFRVLHSTSTQLDIAIFVDNGSAVTTQQTKHAVFLILDALLGEYDVEMRLGAIEIGPADHGTDARPIRELTTAVDSLAR